MLRLTLLVFRFFMPISLVSLKKSPFSARNQIEYTPKSVIKDCMRFLGKFVASILCFLVLFNFSAIAQTKRVSRSKIQSAVVCVAALTGFTSNALLKRGWLPPIIAISTGLAIYLTRSFQEYFSYSTPPSFESLGLSQQISSNFGRAHMYITAQETKAKNLDSRAIFKVRWVVVEEATRRYFLNEKEFLNRNTEDLDIVLIDATGKYASVPMPAPILKEILRYLIQGPTGVDYDCSSFVHSCKAVPFTSGHIDRTLWHWQEFDEALLLPGDAIAIGDSKEAITHLALYLGEKLYLSKFGSSGPLIVTDLASMRVGFGGNQIWQITPIQR